MTMVMTAFMKLKVIFMTMEQNRPRVKPRTQSRRPLHCHPMAHTYRLCLSSQLPLPADLAWARVSTMDGVNAELGPWLKMTVPAYARERSLMDAPIGELSFRSWLLFAGVLPIDRHSLGFELIEAGHFVEKSSSWLHPLWRHERVVEATATATGDGCRLTDKLEFCARVGVVGRLDSALVHRVFRHRHQRLLRWAQRPREASCPVTRGA